MRASGAYAKESATAGPPARHPENERLVSAMRLKVLFFGPLAAEAGKRERSIALPDDATVDRALDGLAAEEPAVARWRGQLAVARNEAYAGAGEALADGDTLALIPPVSGG